MQMKNYEDKRIFKQLAWAKSGYTIFTILIFLIFIGALISTLIGKTVSYISWWLYIYLLITSIIGWMISNVKPINENLTKKQMQNIEERDIETKFWNAEKKLFIWSIIESVFILWYLFGMIGIIFYLFFDYIFALVLMLAFLLFFPKLIAAISCFRAYLYVRQENKKNPPDYVIQEKQRKLLQEKEKNSQTAANLILKTGKLFFVKYYIYLQNYSESDLMDIVKENYSEEIKTQKIRAGKEIFRLGLHKNALQQIVSDTNGSVDERTKDMAKKLLNK
ncbi:hypothetical protein ESZ91_04640 [Candidatus Borkfalkia ceftriaxoniphila]|uniref:Uncharacterized protein n=1 Tax=Candidatus Borkfalkia ceftriaxoniphila TaxID=2508949 RepID=A0A4Q2KDT8_9FIRM|nr:hypothetical protein [Candidatus Borkfalkia ceftriaxoniphila]RXZ61682.1 hypothetical protein ESZ91_04640 [Candidatus Borkfalkia ceftriaxoniphila]